MAASKSAATQPSWLPEDCAIGIDEAGRGPVLGPMVYGCAYCPVSSLSHVASLGFDDSKKLSEEQRERLFEVVGKDQSMGWSVDVCSPEDLSAQMLSKEKVSLNVIAFESTARLIQGVLDRGANLVQAFVDTVGDPDKYQASLHRRFPAITFKVSKKADSLFPIVSAASVVAKVTRDRCLKDWNVAEHRAEATPTQDVFTALDGPTDSGAVEERVTNGEGGVEVGEGAPLSIFGSGYPGDPNTQKWLVEHRDPVFGFPSLVRFSWKTAQTSMDEGCVPVHWGDEQQEDDSGQSSSAKKRRKKSVAFESCAPQRHSFFRTRQLQLISKGL